MVLPPTAISYVTSAINSDVRAHAKSFINLQVRYVRVICDLLFLQACISYRVIPIFITNMISVPEEIMEDKVVLRKSRSLEMEILRTCNRKLRDKLSMLEQRRGYEYLTVTRTISHHVLNQLFIKLNGDLHHMEYLKYSSHFAKWRKISNTEYPFNRAVYKCSYAPIFPFEYVDEYLCRRHTAADVTGEPRLSRSNCNKQDYSNETDVFLPRYLSDLIAKGPNFRIPPLLNEEFMNDVELALDKVTFNLRWSDQLERSDVGLSDCKDNFRIPFHKNRVKMPPIMSNDQELNLALFKKEVSDAIEKEVEFCKQSKSYRKISKQIKNSKHFLKENDLSVVATDKSNRLCVTSNKNMIDRTESILKDEMTYKLINKSKHKALEKQANQLVNNILKNKLSNSNVQRMLVSGTQPARFYTLIKDHKTKNENDEFPLRPIASVVNTPTNKIDWLCGRILNQLTKFVPAHLSSSLELMNCLDNLKCEKVDSNYTFISLDVVNLYPSVPIDTAIQVVSDFAKTHWSLIDNFGISPEQFTSMIKFVSYNYEIEFNGKNYLQIKGCPMGSHYAPPLSIIFMNSIEEKAITKIKSRLGLDNIIYKRYIDDGILGPFDKNDKCFDVILDAFNSVDQNIKFTMENPADGKLNFLDITVWPENGKVMYKKYVKEISSGNALKKDSWLPKSVKNNFVKQSIKDAMDRCSNNLPESMKRESEKLCKTLLKRNGYTDSDLSVRDKQVKNTCNSRPKPNADKKSILKLPFISDSLNRKINYQIRKYKLNIRLVSTGNKKLRNVLKKRSKMNKHPDCAICSKLSKHNCETSCVVYQFSCKVCGDKYIGKTARPFYLRYNEHSNSIKNKNNTSALSEHSQVCRLSGTIDDFNVQFLRCLKDPVETSVVESRLINTYSPRMNRRHETTGAALRI